jgi:2-polyprenyl-3-methyl-5-hydroxy-6-metoxy-1,4-benzoquinol methylase
MRKDGDLAEISGDYQYRALTQGIAIQRFWHHAKLLAVQTYLPPVASDVCLDVGCGSGIVSALLGDRAARVVGIDCNPSAIEFAARQFGRDNVSFRLGYVDKDLNVDGPVDKIYCLEVIEHVYPEQAAEMLNTFHQVLRPGGAVLLTTPNRHSLWPLIEWAMDLLGRAPKLADDQHVEGYHRRKLAALCRAQGFVVETLSAMCFAAPWLAALHWGLAERCFRWESHWKANPGSILVAVLRKP